MGNVLAVFSALIALLATSQALGQDFGQKRKSQSTCREARGKSAGEAGGGVRQSALAACLPRVGSANLLMPSWEVRTSLGVTMIDRAGLAYPGQVIAKSEPSLKAASVLLQGELFPLSFFSSSSIAQYLGLGGTYTQSLFSTDSKVVDDRNRQTAGQLSTTISEKSFEFIFRTSYLEGAMATEIRPILYVGRGVRHTFHGDSDAKSATLANISASGTGLAGIALQQQLLLQNSYRLAAQIRYGLSLKGEASDPMGGPGAPLASPTLYGGDFSASYLYRRLRLGALAAYSKFSGKAAVEYSNPATGKKWEEKYAMSDTRTEFFLALGYSV